MPDIASISSDSFAHDSLLAGTAEALVEKKVTLLSGQNVLRRTVLGKITASGKYVKSLSASADGSEVPAAIAADDSDASAADADCMIYTAGIFNADALILGAGHTIASITDGLHDKGIYLRNGAV